MLPPLRTASKIAFFVMCHNSAPKNWHHLQESNPHFLVRSQEYCPLYEGGINWCRRLDSNQKPLHYQWIEKFAVCILKTGSPSLALYPIELQRQCLVPVARFELAPLQILSLSPLPIALHGHKLFGVPWGIEPSPSDSQSDLLPLH
jgi:hypothetical protein